MAVAANCYLALSLRFDLIKDQILAILSIYALGAFSAFTLTLIVAKLFGSYFASLPRWLVFGLILFTLTTLTIFITAGYFALEYRRFYAAWHAPVFSKVWFFEQAFTTLGAYYQFAVLGLRLYLPATPFIVFLASIILSRRIS